MKKKLLMLSGKESEITFILTARNMGYFVYTTGFKADRPGNKYADKYIPFDYSDYDGMVELAKKLEISAICQGCNDFCALTAAYMGEKLGLKGHDVFETAKIFHQKDAFKKFAKKNNIRTPQSECFDTREDAYAYETLELYPLIVKPTDLAGGAGVAIAGNRKEYEEAVENALKWSHEKKVVVEPYIEGTLHSLSTFLVKNKVAAFGTANDYSYKNRYLTNTGIFPADDWERAVNILIPEIERIADILKLADGLLHLQYIMDESGIPWIIEMMRRAPGNNFTIPLSEATGINWREWIIRAEAGENLEGIPQNRCTDGYYGYHSIMSPANGIVKEIQFDAEFKKHIFQYEEWQGEGYEIKDYLRDKLGNVQYYFSDMEERMKFLPRINELVHVELDDENK